MNILVVENKNSCIKSIIGDLRSRFPNPSILTVDSRNFFESKNILETPPVLTKKWLVFLNPRLSIKQMAHIMEGDNLNVIHLSRVNKGEELYEQLLNEGVNIQYFDNTKASKEDLIDYVLDNLNINSVDAKYLCGRHIYNMKKIIESVSILKYFDNVTRKEIKNYTDRFNKVGVPQLVENLLGLPNCKSKNQVVEVIYRYRYGFDHLLKYVKAELECYIEVFDLIRCGDLSLENFQTYEFTNKSLKKLSRYKIKNIIESFQYLSYDKLYLMKVKVEQIAPNKSSLYELIMLLGG